VSCAADCGDWEVLVLLPSRLWWGSSLRVAGRDGCGFLTKGSMSLRR